MSLEFLHTGDTELSLTLHNRRAQIVDNIFTGTPTLNIMRRTGGVEVDTGGIGMVRALRFEKNGTADSFSGFDTFVISPQDNHTSANFPWASLWAHVAIAWDEELRNMGQAQLINIVNQKIDDAEMAMRDKLNTQLLQAPPVAASKDLIGFHELIDSDANYVQPLRAASIGGINQAVGQATWWRNPISASPAAAFNLATMNALYNDISDGSDFPSFCLTTQTGYEAYEASQVGQIRYESQQVLDASFRSLMYKKTPMVWDPQTASPPTVPTNGAQFYKFINTKYTKLVIHAKGQFVTTDFIEPDNGAHKTAKILFMGNLICTNRRRNGVYWTL